MDTSGIYREWRRLSASGVNNRAAAAALGVSEATLLATGSATMCTRLACGAQTFLTRAQALGPAKYVVRNDYAVLERSGEVRSVTLGADDALFVDGSSFQLRVSGRTGCAFALEEPCADGSVKRSLQLFDEAGVTLVKIVFRSDDCAAAFRLLAGELHHETQSVPLASPCEDTLGGISASTPVRGDVLAAFLRRAADLAHPLRIRVGNAGATLECTTAIQRVKRSSRAPWINVLDPALDLHLYEARIRLLSDEQEAGTQTRTLHWSADDGTLALSTSVSEAFAAWVLSTNGLREPALPA